MLVCAHCKSICHDTDESCPACGADVGAAADASNEPLVGCEIPGGYLIQERIAEGGMGCVYRAEQKALARSVAVKIIHGHLLGDDSVVSRFLVEARAASRMNHPNSVSIIGFGKIEQGRPYLVMEYIRGRDLAEVLHENRAMPFSRIVDILRQTLAALSEAHQLGIIHRDMKPENILLTQMRTRADFVKVVDFGLAKMLEIEESRTMTRPGIVFGTPAYMAPEQLGQGAPDHRTDLYAVGVILFQALTGRTPFEGDTPMKVGIMHLTEAVPDPRNVAPGRNIPEPLALVAMKALQKDPADRYQTADELSQALEDALLEIEPPSRRGGPAGGLIRCPSCHAEIARANKFCPECGAPTWRRSAPPAGPASSQPPDDRSAPPPDTEGAPSVIRLPLPLIDADDHLTWLHRNRTEPGTALGVARLVGESGSGKTRLLMAFLEASRVARDVLVGPDPWWAGVRYYALRRAICELSRLPSSGGSERDWTGASQTAHRGLLEVFERPWTGPPLSPDACRYAIAEALRWAIRRADASPDSKRIVLAIDDLHRVDGATRNALCDVLEESPHARLLVIGTHPPDFDPGWPGEAHELEGLPRPVVQEFVRRSFPPNKTGLYTTPFATTSPLYFEQLIRFRGEGGGDPPTQLADLVALRLERFGARERHVLQALAVLGDDVHVEALRSVLLDSEGTEAALASLSQAHIVEKGPSGLRWTHPLLREVATETIPVAVRRDLYQRAAEAAKRDRAPLEVLASYLLHAERGPEALALFEEIAERALACGDNSGAVLALQHGLNLARRGMWNGGLEDPMRAMVLLNRKLADALLRAGDATAAHGALREALDMTGPSDPDRHELLEAFDRIGRSRAARPRPGDPAS